MTTTTIIREGAAVTVRSATGELTRRAVTGPVAGQDFTVIWLATEEEWKAAATEGRAPKATPWPAEDVRVTDA